MVYELHENMTITHNSTSVAITWQDLRDELTLSNLEMITEMVVDRYTDDQIFYDNSRVCMEFLQDLYKANGTVLILQDDVYIHIYSKIFSDCIIPLINQ